MPLHIIELPTTFWKFLRILKAIKVCGLWSSLSLTCCSCLTILVYGSYCCPILDSSTLKGIYRNVVFKPLPQIFHSHTTFVWSSYISQRFWKYRETYKYSNRTTVLIIMFETTAFIILYFSETNSIIFPIFLQTAIKFFIQKNSRIFFKYLVLAYSFQ